MALVQKVSRVIGWLAFGIFGTVGVGAAVVAWSAISVRVDLPPEVTRVSTWSWDDGFVYASGTFTFEDNAVPLQTSKITCIARTQECRELRAEIRFGDLLNVDEDTYTIKKWDRETLIFSTESACFRETYTIIRASEQIVGSRVRKSTDGQCAVAIGSPSPLEVTLTDGDKIVQELHGKAFQRAAPVAVAGLAFLWVFVAWRIRNSTKWRSK